MSDLISRQTAIDAVHQEFDECLVWDESGQTTADEVERILDYLPSAEPRGIPVTERLPERNYNCLVADDGTIVYGYMNFIGEWMDCLGDKLKYVSHWMPLPQPPKDGES